MDKFKAHASRNEKGVRGAERVESGLYHAVGALVNNNLTQAISLVSTLKDDLTNNFGENNFIWKSNAIKAVDEIKLELKRAEALVYKSSIRTALEQHATEFQNTL
ncbi:MAG: hypothetical protein ACRCXC_08330 [Legionella sp.]